MCVGHGIGLRMPIPQKPLVLAVIPFDVRFDCSSRRLVSVNVGGDNEFEVESVKRDGENGIGSFA